MSKVTALPTDSTRGLLRDRIVAVSADLLARGGREAVTTRAVAAAAGVQAPTLYRLFGDKVGLLDAVAAHGFASYLARKQHSDVSPDPVDALRAGWDLHVGFGLANPALYALMYGDPRPSDPSPAAVAALQVLGQHVRRIAETGRLGIREQDAVGLVQACGTGTVLTLLVTPEEQRDLTLSAVAREACVNAITVSAPAATASGLVAAAVALGARLDGVTTLTPAELSLLEEWLHRLTAPEAAATPGDGHDGPTLGWPVGGGR